MSDDKHAIVIDAPVALQRESIGMHPLAALAMQNPSMLTPDGVEKMLELQRQYEAMEAKRAFDVAKINLMREMPKIIGKNKDGHNSRYATLDKILTECEPHLSKWGFSLAWKTETTDRMIVVSCRLTHALGHFDESTLSAPPETSGSKNPVQAIGSTVKYLKRYTASCVLGIDEADMPDAGDRLESKKQQVNTQRNLQAVAKLRTVGISLERAQQFVGRDVQEWTEADLEDLIALYKEEKSAQEANAQNEVDAQ